MSDEVPSADPPQSTYLMTFLLSFILLMVTMFVYPLW